MVALASVGAGAFARHGQADALLAVASQAHDHLLVWSWEGCIIEGVTSPLVDAPVWLTTPGPGLLEPWVLVGMAHRGAWVGTPSWVVRGPWW